MILRGRPFIPYCLEYASPECSGCECWRNGDQREHGSICLSERANHCNKLVLMMMTNQRFWLSESHGMSGG